MTTATLSSTVACESNPCRGGLGSQILIGGAGDDTIFGERGNDTIYGNEGNDALYGGIGDEKLISGGAGQDLLSGGPGFDILNGNQDSDLVRGDATIDEIRDTGSTGSDTLSFATGIAPGFGGSVAHSGFPSAGNGEERGVRVHLDGGEACTELHACNGPARYGGGNDVIDASGFENVIGSPFADIVIGSDGANRLEGGGGADILIGGGGDDVLVGGAEGDYLEGGSGSDTAIGEAGTNRCAADVESQNQCSGSEMAVTQRDRTKISAGLMTTTFASSVQWTQLYLVGSNTGRDSVSTDFWIGGNGVGHVTFTAQADSATFNLSGEATTAHCTYEERKVDCALPAPPDVILLAGMGGDDHLSVAGAGLWSTASIVLLGGEGNDYLQGSGTTEDVLIDGPGTGSDELHGYGYDDFLTNNEGTDSLQGGNGNDLLVSAAICGSDTLQGAESGSGDGAAQNNASWAQLPGPSGVVADLDSQTAGDYWSNGPACSSGSLDQPRNIDDLEGSSQADALFGDGAPNNILGRKGGDGLWGRGGVDRIEGEDSEQDNIGGGGGTDECYWDVGLDAHTECDLDTKTFLSDAERLLAGQPGYVSAHGYVKFVPTGTSEEKALDGAKVYVNFSKWNGSGWEYKWQIWDHSDGTGRYEFKDQSITPGKWRIKGILGAQGSYLPSESGWHEFTIKKGYRLRPKHSNKCMSASGNKRANGTAIIQWDCSPSPNPTDGQVFTLVPVGSNFNIVVNQSSACLDVAGVSTANGAKLQLWGCLGPGQTNQVWQRVGIQGDSPYVGFIAQHSGKCADVLGVSHSNGAAVGQWDCVWGNNQRWLLDGIE